MRLKIIFEAKSDLLLTIHYNHIIQKVIYDLLDEKYASFLHNEGFSFGGKRFQLFTFSRLVIESKDVYKEAIRIKPGKVYLTVSSIDERFIFSIIDGLLKEKVINLQEGKLYLQNIFARKNLVAKKFVGLTISPVVVAKGNTSKPIEFYTPGERKFLEVIEDNLKFKYASYYGEEYSGKLSVKFLDETNIKRVVAKYKKWPYEGYLGGFIIEGNDKIVDVAYSCGIGNKNAQGFGCLELISDINKFDNYLKII
jgi:CRISPR-associated endoribonuclease Cas6